MVDGHAVSVSPCQRLTALKLVAHVAMGPLWGKRRGEVDTLLLVIIQDLMSSLTHPLCMCGPLPSPLAALDLLVNVVVGMSIVVLNFLVLAFSSDLLSFVLNSVACLFIIQLDEAAVFIDSDGVGRWCRSWLAVGDRVGVVVGGVDHLAPLLYR